MYSRSKEKRISFLKGLSVSIVLVAMTAGAYQFVIVKKVQENTVNNYLIAQEKQYGKMVTVYLAPPEGVTQGSSLEGKLIPKQTYSSLAGVDYVKSEAELKDKVIRFDVQPNTIITESMLVKTTEEITNNLKLYEFTGIKSMTGLQKGDYIDVRYKKKNGEDFVVLSKKKIEDIADNKFKFKLHEDELMYMNNALAEQTQSPQNGGEIYASLYIDPQNQEAAPVTYKINPNIQKIIDANNELMKEAAEKASQSVESETTKADSVTKYSEQKEGE